MLAWADSVAAELVRSFGCGLYFEVSSEESLLMDSLCGVSQACFNVSLLYKDLITY